MDTFAARRVTGHAYLRKLGGSGPAPTGTEVVVPYQTCEMQSPANDAYVPGVSGEPGTVVRGKLTPSVALKTSARSGWLSAALLNSLVVCRDVRMDADTWRLRSVPAEEEPSVYQGIQFGTLSMAHRTAGGPVPIALAGLATDPDGRAESAAEEPMDGAEELYSSTVHYEGGAVAGLVRSWRLLVQCPQHYEFSSNSSPAPSWVVTGPIRGILQVEGPASAVTIPGGSVTIRVYDLHGRRALSITARLEHDRKWRPVNSGFGNLVGVYTLAGDVGGEPPISFR